MNGQGNKQVRNVAFDILRLVAMLMVTMLHITGHGLEETTIEPFSGAYWITLFLNTFSLVAVNCFVLISGYFLSTKTTSVKKLAILWLQVWTYSVLIYIVLCFIPGINVNFRISTLIECMCPLLSNQYWFFTCYFLLYLIAPILNKLVESWSQQEYRKALIILVVAFSVIPSVSIWGDSFGTNRGYSFIWFTILYLIAAYIRKFDFQWPVHPAVAYLIPCAALCVFQVAVSAWNPGMGSIQSFLSNQCSYNGPLVLCASVGLLAWAKNASLKAREGQAKVISTMASLSFGVYLLHDHGTIRAVLWNDWVRLADVTESSGAFFLRIIIVLISLFIMGLVVEFVRQRIMAVIPHISCSKKQS